MKSLLLPLLTTILLAACGPKPVPSKTTDEQAADVENSVLGDSGFLDQLVEALKPLLPAGPKGDKGDTGDTGLTGTQGVQGEQGAKGDQGDVGPMGLQGLPGLQGDMGPQGLQGPQGDVGPQGPKGDQGNVGPKGDTGAQGPQGATGDAGPTGASGSKGDKGDTGPAGPTGAQGPPGSVGASGGNGNTSVLQATRVFSAGGSCTSPPCDYVSATPVSTTTIFVPPVLNVIFGNQNTGTAFVVFDGFAKCTYTGNNKSGSALALYQFTSCADPHGNALTLGPGQPFAYSGTISLAIGTGEGTNQTLQVVGFFQIQ